MDNEKIFKKYVHSAYTIKKFQEIKEQLKEEIIKADPLWRIIFTKDEEETDTEEESMNESNTDDNDISHDKSNDFASTQFYFTQVAGKNFNTSTTEHLPNSDVKECLFEELEHSNGKLDLNQLRDLTESELVEISCDLEKRLSIQGTYNICCSINNMTLDERIKYAPIFYTHLLLPKIIALEEPSRLLSSVLVECVQKSPEDIQNYIFIPLINLDLKDTTITETLVHSFESQRRIVLIQEYLSNVKELKTWHLSFLHTLITTKTDVTINDKLIQLFSKKALDFAKDKSFGKLVLSFVKINNLFTEEQQHLLQDIASINETYFKKSIQSVLKTVKSKKSVYNEFYE